MNNSNDLYVKLSTCAAQERDSVWIRTKCLIYSNVCTHIIMWSRMYECN